MKALMLGNEAVARGLFESGCEFVSSYPGTPSTEITESAGKYSEIYAEWAPNEKVAMESSFGASLAGKRSFCAMKHVGLNVASDPLFTISYTGVNAGLVIGVADDPGMHSSQNEQDSRNYAKASKLPMLEPSDSAEALEYTKLAFELSEEYDTPVLLKMCTRVAHSESIVETGERKEVAKPYEKNPQKYIMTPANAKLKHPIVEERLKRLAEFAENSDINKIFEGESNDIGFISSSTSFQYIKEVFGDKYPILKLGMIYPMPKNKILAFADRVKRLVVVEELDGFVESYLNELGLKPDGKNLISNIGELSQNKLREAFLERAKEGYELEDKIPVRPPVMCAGCPHRSLFYTLAKNKLTVLGDIGCYTLGSAPPLFALDSTVCMGASVSGLHGFNKATKGEREDRTVAVIGDSTFIHSGITGLVSISYNASNSVVIILDNSITGMTGHQQNPTTGKNLKGDPATKIDLESLCRAVGINRVRVVDPYDLEECDRVINEELKVKEPSVIISRRPCALLKYVKHEKPLRVDKDKCRSCKACMKIGCPAISIVDGKAKIDETLCVGCGVCEQLCKFDALKREER